MNIMQSFSTQSPTKIKYFLNRLMGQIEEGRGNLVKNKSLNLKDTMFRVS
jgi:hypothetical protein